MAVATTPLGPGTLTLGETTASLDVSCQLIGAQVEADKTKEDDETTLCGDVVTGDVTYTYTLSGTMFQDLAIAGGVVDYTWTNTGQTVPFVFTPNTVAAAKVEGDVLIDPLMVGGDEPKAKMRSEFTWDIVGTPTFTPGTGTPPV